VREPDPGALRLKKLARSRWVGLRALIDTAGLGGKPLRGAHWIILAPGLMRPGGASGDANDGLPPAAHRGTRKKREAARRARNHQRRARAMISWISTRAIEW